MSGTIDFYNILEVNKQATADEIKISYKKLARVWHPDKNPDPVKKTEAETKFKEISQAYDVLKDPDKRKAYDWELEDQAYNSTLAAPPPWNYQPTSSFSAGWTSTTGFYYHERYPPNNWFRDSMPGGGYHGSSGGGGYDGWSFGSSDSGSLGGSSLSSSTRSGGGGGFGSAGGEPRKTAHFGSSRKCSTRCDSCDSGEPSKAASFGGSRSNSTNSSGGGDVGGIGGEPRKAAPVEHVLLCTLEELYNGGTKEILITRKTIDASGTVQTREEKEIIDVKPGWKKGTRITFPGKGDQLEPGVIPADVVYEVDEIPHHVYKRDGDNLIAFHQITKAELNSGQFFLPTLDGKKDLMVRLPSNKEKAGNLDRPNEGMPISKEPGKKGNLRITYWVEGGRSPIKRVAKSLTRALTLITCFRRRKGVVY